MKNPVCALFAVLMGVAVVAGSSGAALAQTSSAPAAQQQRIHGSVVSVQGSTMTFKADDGRTLTVDMSKVNPQVQKALTPNEKATLMGVPGSQPNQFTAQFIQQDSSDPARGGQVAGQTPAPAASAAASTSSQWQDVHGSVVSVQGNTLTFKADDGRTLTVDMKAVSPQVQQALKANEGATLIGFAGSQPNQFTAQFIQQDSSDPSRGGKVVGQTATATDKAWQRLHGTVTSISGNTLSLKMDDGQALTVDTAQVDAGIRGSIKTGDPVTVIGFYRLDDKKKVDKKNLEARFIQKDSSAAASPKTTK